MTVDPFELDVAAALRRRDPGVAPRTLFDRIGRRVMIAVTYALSGVGLALTGVGFLFDALDATTQTLAWSGVFFLASAAASSAYLTVSEVFPLEMRALSISIF